MIGRREVENHSRFFIFRQLRYHVEILTKYCRALKDAFLEVYARSVGKFVINKKCYRL